MIKTKQSNIDDKIEFNHTLILKTQKGITKIIQIMDGLCYCPKNEQLIVYDWQGKKVKSGICKRCSGKINNHQLKGGTEK